MDLSLVVAVDLQANQAIRIVDTRIGLGVIQGGLAVEEDRDPRTFGPDFILVPFALLLEFGDLRVGLDAIGTDTGTRAGQELLTTGFIVEGTSVPLTNVSLVADHLVGRVGRAQAAELDARVHEPFGTDELILERQAEVIKGALGRQEFVAGVSGHRTTHDLAVLDPPDLRVPFPSRERLAIEQRRWCCKESEDSSEQGQNGCETLHGGIRVRQSARGIVPRV